MIDAGSAMPAAAPAPMLRKKDGEFHAGDAFCALLCGTADIEIPVLVRQAPLPETGEDGKAVALPVDGGGDRSSQSESPVVRFRAAADALPSRTPVEEKSVRLEELKERFDQRLLSMVQRGEKVMRITVQPAALGRLTVVCREENSTLAVEILAQSQPVRELIAAQEDAVRRLMEAHSVELGSFDVFLEQEEADGRRFGAECRTRSATARGTGPATEEIGEPHALHPMKKGGVVSLIA